MSNSEDSQELAKAKLMPLSRARLDRKTKSRSTGKDEDKIPLVEKFSHLAALLDRRSDLIPARFANHPFPHVYKVVNFDEDDEFKILKIITDSNGKQTCRLISRSKVVYELTNYLSNFAVGECEIYHMEPQTVGRAVGYWLATTDHMERMPKAVAFANDPELAFSRLPFTPVRHDADWRNKATTFAEMFGRISNADALMARIGSIFEPNADRKQAIWISGPKDCGKSQLDKILRYICGYDADLGTTGGYTSLGSRDMESAHWKAALVGKRVVSVLEARSNFLNRDDFKSVTGDDVHMINEKCRPMYTAKIDALMFFYSNEPPHIDSKDEVIERVIDCRISPLEQGNMIPGHLVFRMLKNELPFFLGACMDTYQRLCPDNERIPNSKDTLLEASEEHEAWAIEIFDEYFVVAQEHEISAGDVRAWLQTKFRFNNYKVNECLRIWNGYYGVERIRSNKSRKLRGLNWKATREY